MTHAVAAAEPSTKSAAENDSGESKRKRRLRSRLLFCDHAGNLHNYSLFFLSDVDRGNTKGKFMKMNVSEAGFGNHPRKLLL